MPTLSVEERPNIPAVRTPQDKAHVVAFALGTLHSIVNAALFLHLFSHSGWGGWTTAVGGSVIIMAFIHWIFFLLQILPKRDLLFDKYYKLRAWQRWIVSALLLVFSPAVPLLQWFLEVGVAEKAYSTVCSSRSSQSASTTPRHSLTPFLLSSQSSSSSGQSSRLGQSLGLGQSTGSSVPGGLDMGMILDQDQTLVLGTPTPMGRGQARALSHSLAMSSAATTPTPRRAKPRLSETFNESQFSTLERVGSRRFSVVFSRAATEELAPHDAIIDELSREQQLREEIAIDHDISLILLAVASFIETIPQTAVQLLWLSLAPSTFSTLQLVALVFAFGSAASKAYILSLSMDANVFKFKLHLCFHDIFAMYLVLSSMFSQYTAENAGETCFSYINAVLPAAIPANHLTTFGLMYAPVVVAGSGALAVTMLSWLCRTLGGDFKRGYGWAVERLLFAVLGLVLTGVALLPLLVWIEAIRLAVLLLPLERVEPMKTRQVEGFMLRSFVQNSTNEKERLDRLRHVLKSWIKFARRFEAEATGKTVANADKLNAINDHYEALDSRLGKATAPDLEALLNLRFPLTSPGFRVPGKVNPAKNGQDGEKSKLWTTIQREYWFWTAAREIVPVMIVLQGLVFPSSSPYTWLQTVIQILSAVGVGFCAVGMAKHASQTREYYRICATLEPAIKQKPISQIVIRKWITEYHLPNPRVVILHAIGNGTEQFGSTALLPPDVQHRLAEFIDDDQMLLGDLSLADCVAMRQEVLEAQASGTF